jgi:CRISPR system Cascade subunit CasE
MLLSRIQLAPEVGASRELGPLLASPYRLHKAVWTLFADHAGRRRDFLYRLEWDSGRPLLWTLSERPPRPMPRLWQARTRELKPVLRPGERLRFLLRANPVVTRGGKRHDLVMEAKQRLRTAGVPKDSWPSEGQLAQEHGTAWLTRHSEGRGFAVDPAQLLVTGYEVHTFTKGEGEEIRFATCDFQGVLTVTDADALVRTVRQGIGPAKGFGCGLILLRRAD